jgi:hypothetical protein
MKMRGAGATMIFVVVVLVVSASWQIVNKLVDTLSVEAIPKQTLENYPWKANTHEPLVVIKSRTDSQLSSSLPSAAPSRGLQEQEMDSDLPQRP